MTKTPVVISIFDGITTAVVPACATRHHTINASDTGTGYGEIEYMSGRARRWNLFRRRTWAFETEGRAATGIEALNLDADFWTATFRNPLDPEGDQLVVKIVPFSPGETYNQPSAKHTASIVMRETLS